MKEVGILVVMALYFASMVYVEEGTATYYEPPVREYMHLHLNF